MNIKIKNYLYNFVLTRSLWYNIYQYINNNLVDTKKEINLQNLNSYDKSYKYITHKLDKYILKNKKFICKLYDVSNRKHEYYKYSIKLGNNLKVHVLFNFSETYYVFYRYNNFILKIISHNDETRTHKLTNYLIKWYKQIKQNNNLKNMVNHMRGY